jgi:UDP-N-acetylglucosamine transferase subunit ALG13
LIFVTVGTHGQQFNRLLESVDALPASQQRIVQYGCSTYKIKHGSAYRFIEFDEVVSLMSRAEVVVSHGGVGSIVLALAAGQRPVVAPRLHRFGEHVDDHQLEVAESFARAGKVIPFMPGDDLMAKIADASRDRVAAASGPSSELIEFMHRAIVAGRRG